MSTFAAPNMSSAEALSWAANYAEPGAELGRADFELLGRASQSGVVEPEQFNVLLRNLCAGQPLVLATRERFDRVMDLLFGYGFRDPALPELAADYRDFLDAAKHALEVSEDAFAEMLAQADDGATPEHVTGEAFGYCLYGMFIQRRMAIPALPERNHMGRAAVGRIHAAVDWLNLSYAEHANVLVTHGGGCLRTRDLDVHGAQRVLARYCAEGWENRGPAPRVEARPGFVTQPQANLIWRLAGQMYMIDGDALIEWLRENAGIEGGLPALTAAGAGYVLDRMLPHAIGLRKIRAAQRSGASADAASGTPA